MQQVERIRKLTVPIESDGRTIGTLSVDVTPPQEPGLESFVRVVAGMIGETVKARPPSGDEPVMPMESGHHALRSLEDATATFERSLIADALKTTRGNRAKAARLLQTTERILGYKVRKYAIDCERFRP